MAASLRGGRESLQFSESVDRAPTILDVLDATLDGRGAEAFLDRGTDIFEFLRLAREFYERWSAPARSRGEVRVFSTVTRLREFHRLPAVAIQTTDDRIDNVRRANDLDGFVLAHMRRTASGTLLYADSVVEIDPISYLFETSISPGDDEEAIEYLRVELANAAAILLSEARPLIDAGVLILAPAPREKHWMFTDIKTASEILGVTTAKDWQGTAAPRFDCWERSCSLCGSQSLPMPPCLVTTRTFGT